MGLRRRSRNHGSYADGWTEDATTALIQIWGERYLDLNRGNLRREDWNFVSAAVNRHLVSTGKPRKTYIQCQNRIYALKRKFKIENVKRGSSTWRFYPRLDVILGSDRDLDVTLENWLEIRRRKVGTNRDLADAIARFGEVYEKTEAWKRRRIAEMERERMEFARKMKSQWMQFFEEVELRLRARPSR